MREVICVLTFNKGNKVWFLQTINADIDYSETPKHVVLDITPGVSSTWRTQCGDCIFPLVISNVTKVLSNTVKQGYMYTGISSTLFITSIHNWHTFPLREKKVSSRVSFGIQQFAVLTIRFSLMVKLLCDLLWIIYCTLITLINRIPIKSWIHYFNKHSTFCQ